MKYTRDPKFKANMLLATYIVVLAYVLLNLKVVGSTIGGILHILRPFLIAMCVAFVINLPMRFLEDKVVTPMFKSVKNKKPIRPIALLLTFAIIIGLLIGLTLFIIPQLVESTATLAKNIPDYIKSLEEVMGQYMVNVDILNDLWAKVLSMGENIIKVVGQATGSLITQVVGVTVGITSTIVSFLMGCLIAIYILLSKEKLCLQSKKIIYAFIERNKADKIMAVIKISNLKFSKFVSGQCIEAVILGTLCFVGMLLFSMPYATLISTIIGITALVPIFGALIGTIPGAFIIFMVDPVKALWFIVLIIVVQQIEGNLIYPLVVGNSIGLSAIWVLLAITIGGSTFGIIGILIGIPLFGIIYTVFSTVVHDRLKNREIDINDLEKKAEE